MAKLLICAGMKALVRDERMFLKLLGGLFCGIIERITRMDRPELTERQIEICKLVASGKADKQIAGELRISEGTVSFHLSRLFVKAKVHSRVELVLWFLFLSPAAMRRFKSMAAKPVKKVRGKGRKARTATR